MWLIKDNRTGRFYKTKHSIADDRLCGLHGQPFIKAGVMSEEESLSSVLCTDKWPQIEQVTLFDGRVRSWMRDCDWFTWLVVIQ